MALVETRARVGGGATRRGWSLRFRTLVALVMVVSMASLAGLLLWQGWQGARATMQAAANQYASDVASLINEKARRILAPAEVTLRQMTYNGFPLGADGQVIADRLSVLGDALAYNSLISAAYAARADGSFVLLRPLDSPHVRQQFDAPERATFMLQVVERRSNGPVRGLLVFSAISDGTKS